ncbi:MAG: DUF4349 domain-containing protein [Alphaproteobacteria bacterium]|nr:DUF4349 domain-containing protein [Alphaproteobacteria bacterium]
MKQILLSVFFAFMMAGCAKTLPITPIDAPVVSASDGAAYDAGRDASDADMKSEMPARQQSNKIDVDIKVTDAATASGEIQKLVTDMGGYVKSGTASHVIAYVPADRADRFLDRMGTDIGKLRKIDRSVTDVTDTGNDVAAKLESMIAVRTRYTELLAKTTDVDQIMKIESELQRVNANILALQGQLANIKTQVQYTLFNIDIDDTTIWSGVKTMFKTPAFYVLLLPFVALAL